MVYSLSRRSDYITLAVVIAAIAVLTAKLATLYGQPYISIEMVEEAICFEDNTCVITYENGTELHSGQGLNPTASVPTKLQYTLVYPNGTTSADNVTAISHQYFADNSCQTMWSNNQTDVSRSSSEGPLLETEKQSRGDELEVI